MVFLSIKASAKFSSVADIRQQCYVTRTLDSDGQLALMLCAGAGNSSRKDLRALGDVLSQACYILVIDLVDVIGAELADLLTSAHCGTVRLGRVSFGLLSIHFVSFLSVYNSERELLIAAQHLELRLTAVGRRLRSLVLRGGTVL